MVCRDVARGCLPDCSPSAGPARTAHDLEQQHPRLRVEVTELEPEIALPALVAGEFDIVLGEEYPGHPLPRPRETERHDLLTDELRLITPTGWSGRSLPSLASLPFAMEPVGTTAREWATAVCRQAGFEPEVRYTSTDLQIHLRLVECGLAAALLPDLSGAGTGTRWWHTGSTVVRGDKISRRGAAHHPKVRAATTAPQGPGARPGSDLTCLSRSCRLPGRIPVSPGGG